MTTPEPDALSALRAMVDAYARLAHARADGSAEEWLSALNAQLAAYSTAQAVLMKAQA